MDSRRILVRNSASGGSDARSQVSGSLSPSRTRRDKERKKSKKKKNKNKQRRRTMVAEDEVEIVAPIRARNNNDEVINTTQSPNPKWDKAFRINIGKQTAVEYMTKHYVFPSPDDFVAKDNNGKASYFTTMKQIVAKSHQAAEMAGFDVFFCENRRPWKRACNDFRTSLVNKAKIRYFSKYD